MAALSEVYAYWGNHKKIVPDNVEVGNLDDSVLVAQCSATVIAGCPLVKWGVRNGWVAETLPKNPGKKAVVRTTKEGAELLFEKKETTCMSCKLSCAKRSK